MLQVPIPTIHLSILNVDHFWRELLQAYNNFPHMSDVNVPQAITAPNEAIKNSRPVWYRL